MNLDEFNSLDGAHLHDVLQQCCASEFWITKMIASHPFANVEELQESAMKHWQALDDEDYLQAFSAHPMIGDVNSLKAKFANTKAIAAGEQSGAADVDEATLVELHRLNQEYLAQHGFIFIIFATGKSAIEMLEAIRQRIDNTTAQEVRNAAAEQIKITLLRLNKLMLGQ